MPFLSNGEIRYYQFEQMGHGLTHAFFTRRGGVSPHPWSSLNLGSTVGDDLERVSENRRLALASLGFHPGSIFDVWQIHSTDVAIADAPRKAENPHLKADGILTAKQGVTLLMRFADCVPILLHDPVRGVVGIVHAGWMGTVKGTVRYAVDMLKNQFGSNAEDIRAGIGPSIGPDHYEVGSQVVQLVQQAFPIDSTRLLKESSGHVTFDLWEANRLLLEKEGLRNVEVAGLCTACHPDDWYTHRGEKGRTGRFGAVIALV